MLTIRIIYITSFCFVKSRYLQSIVPLIISNTFQPTVRWHMTQSDERASTAGNYLEMKRSSVRADPVYLPELDFEKPSAVSSTRSTLTLTDPGKMTVDEAYTLTSFWSNSHDRTTCDARAEHRSLAKWSVFPARGRGRVTRALSWARPISLLSTAMTPVDPTGWPLRLSPAALLTHGNRLYRKAYLVPQRESGLTIEGSDSASN